MTYLLALCLLPTLALSDEAASSTHPLAGVAESLVRAYHAGGTGTLEPHFASSFRFRDSSSERELDLVGFFDRVERRAAAQSELEIEWVGLSGELVDVRGTHRSTDAEEEQQELQFSIELRFDTDGQVVSWVDDFRRRLRKPALGDRELQTDHFRFVYFESEFSTEEANRLGRTFETWYERTREYLGRSFQNGYRLDVNVAGAHSSPYATDPGPHAFILVSTRSAKREYGFSLVHELTHNLMGLSWLCENEHQRNDIETPAGNRLFDEGFAVFVEEELTGEAPRVWPNFSEETHAAYWRLRVEEGEPIWPPLEAEIHREHGNRRLGYLAQASFCKHLVETYGLEKFVQLFAAHPDSAPQIYGRSLDELTVEWREALVSRFGE